MTEGGSRLGRWVGLVEFWATMAAVAGLILWPKVVGAIWATVTWTQDEKDACTAVPGCVVNLVPGGVVPVGWAIAWVAVILAGIVLCWSPDRWWTSRGRGPFEFIADSSPRWLRAHAGVSAVVCLLLVLPGRGITTTWAFEYAIPTALGLAAAGLATLSIRHARRILPAATFHRLVGDSILIDGVERQLARKSRAKPLPASTHEVYDRAPAGKRAGRVIAWTVAVVGILATFFIALFPFVGQFVALGTWSADERESCIATDGCSVTVLSIGAGYAWVGLAWVAIVIAAILICWSPRRWWTPTGSVTPLRPGVFSTPEWFRLHALGALAINAIGLAITGGRLQDSWVWEFLWPIALAGVAIILATVCVRATAAHIDPATREGLAKSYDFWLSRRECLLRSRVPVGSRIRVPLKGDTDRSEPPMGAC